MALFESVMQHPECEAKLSAYGSILTHAACCDRLLLVGIQFHFRLCCNEALWHIFFALHRASYNSEPLPLPKTCTSCQHDKLSPEAL
jgi:hypothetical protein